MLDRTCQVKSGEQVANTILLQGEKNCLD